MLITKGDVRGVLEIEKHVRNFNSSYMEESCFVIYENLNGSRAKNQI
jgi:hypothetical protein